MTKVELLGAYYYYLTLVNLLNHPNISSQFVLNLPDGLTFSNGLLALASYVLYQNQFI